MHINIHEILVGTASNGFQWSTFLTSLCGVVVGGLITLFTSTYTVQKNYENNFDLLKKQEELETKATIKAIIAELKALKQIFDVEFIPKILNSKEEYLNYSYPLGTDYFSVFNANTSKIGKITNDELRECVINIYITAKFFLDCIATNNTALEFYEKCLNKVYISSYDNILDEGTPKAHKDLEYAKVSLMMSIIVLLISNLIYILRKVKRKNFSMISKR